MVTDNLCGDFDVGRMSGLTARVADLVSHQQFTGIADMGHDNIEIHEAVSSEAFMRGLACGGVKNFTFENLDVVGAGIFRAYRDGQISEDDLQLIGQAIFVTISEVDYDLDPVRSRQVIIDYMKHAKQFGIELHSVNHGEGLYTEEEAAVMLRFDSLARDVFLSIVVENPDFKSTAQEEKLGYIFEETRIAFEGDTDAHAL